jgi:ankyrin repeat protein
MNTAGFHCTLQISQPDGNSQLPIHHVLRTSDVSLGTIKLMAAANPTSLTTADSQGFIPLHIACKVGHVDVVKYLVEFHTQSLRVETLKGYLLLHLACMYGKCNVVNYIMERSDYGVSLRIHGQLPFDLLLSDC